MANGQDGEAGRAGLTIDAHHHLWRYRAPEYGWINDAMAALRRDFLPAELEREIRGAGVQGTVAVQARETVEETNWLLECARSSPAIRGVVGWAPLAADNLAAVLDGWSEERRLVGFREIAQGKPAGFLDEARFNRGVGQLAERNLTYDVLIYENQLQEAIRFVDAHPRQRFVLDHAAKPRIAAAELEPWRTHLRDLARRENVVCKVSGFVTEADWERWTPEDLRPYLDVCVEAFGVERLLAGSDWPVCLTAASYSRWWAVLRQYFAAFRPEEKQRIFGGNAMEFYALP